MVADGTYSRISSAIVPFALLMIKVVELVTAIPVVLWCTMANWWLWSTGVCPVLKVILVRVILYDIFFY